MAEFGDYLSSIFVLVATLLVAIVICRSRSNRKYPPSLPWLPVVGSLPFMIGSKRSYADLPQLLMEKSAKLGNVFSFYGGSKYTVVLNGREAIYEAFVKRSVDFSGRNVYLPVEKYKLRHASPGISLRQYDNGFKQIQQQTLSILKDFGFGKRIMEERITIEVAQLLQQLKKKNGEAFDCREMLTRCIANVIYSILFGRKQDRRIIELINSGNTVLTTMVPEVDFIPFLQYLPNYKSRMLQHVSSTEKYNAKLDESIDAALQEDNDDESFVRSFVNGGSARSELTSMMQDLMIGGTETSSNTLEWSFILLANHPEVQVRLHQEIDSVIPRDRLPILDDKSKLPYVEASILEVMRYKTLVPFAVPHKTLCDTEVGGYFVPQNTQVIPNLYSAHMDPKAWKDPTVFRPERFLDDDGKVIGRELIISFSLGKRSCLGEQLARQELFLFFASILQHLEIRPPEGQRVIEYEETLSVTLAPTPFKVRLIPRCLN